MRTARIKLDGRSYYHVISRIVDGRLRLGKGEKEHFRRLMRAYATFSGLNILTYSILGNHFHILLEVPEREHVDEEAVVLRMRAIYTDRQVREHLARWAMWRTQGQEALVGRELDCLRSRMYDVSPFMKSLKQRFSQWYNRHAGRRGTLWEDRFKSILVEGEVNALATIAAYIDLNAVRAGLVGDPKDYRWCGYAEALGGSAPARLGLGRVMDTLGAGGVWAQVRPAYRRHLYGTGEERGVDAAGRALRAGISRAMVEKTIKDGGKLSRHALLRCRVRYFSDGVALGGREFVENVFRLNRERFGPRRRAGARAMRFGEWGGLVAARDLRLAPIAVSPGIR